MIDGLFQRYQNPYEVINNRLEAGSLNRFFSYLKKKRMHEFKEKRLWSLCSRSGDRRVFEMWKEEVETWQTK